jgi:hypothetical protein
LTWGAVVLGIGAAVGLACSPQIGKKCSISTDCSQLGDRLCDSTQPGGYCTVFNCEPDSCPNAICVGFDPTLDPACGTAANGRPPRFERTFCLAQCSSTSDCRDQYECVDLSTTANQTLRRARVVDVGAGDGGLGFSVCMTATCADGLKDGAETDVDCGGICNACANKLQCGSGSDCASSTCSNGTCVAQHCTNGFGPTQDIDAGVTIDLTETDIDCGGPDCAPCKGLQGCMVPSDCASGSCVSGVCGIGDCTNHVQDYYESDIDCGGTPKYPSFEGTCPRCATGQRCWMPSDCASGYCILNTDPMTMMDKPGVCGPPPPPAVCSLPAADAGPVWPDGGP